MNKAEKKFIFRKYSWNPKHHPLLAIDFENNPNTKNIKTSGFICAGVHGEYRVKTISVKLGKKEREKTGNKYKDVDINKKVDLYFTDQDKVMEFLQSLPANSCLLNFFNLGYDFTFLNPIIDHSTVVRSGSKWISAKLKGNKLQAMDLTNHLDGTLEDWFGYLNLKEKGIKKAKLKDHEARVMNDARGTWEVGTFLENFYVHECKIPLHLTVASSALKLFRRHFFKDYWERIGEKWGDFERQAYYGGRCEVYKRGVHKTWGYDVNSMYLSVMQENLFPDMWNTKEVLKPPPDWLRYLTTYQGIWDVEVNCPDLNIPLLPQRIKVNGVEKLYFRVGTFRGVWTSTELNKALEIGYKILKVYKFFYYPISKPYFKEFANWIWNQRKKYKKNKNRGMELMIKKLGNSLYGKFGQRNKNGYFGRLEDYKGNLPKVYDSYIYNDEEIITVQGESSPAKHNFTAISAFISSYARIKIYEAIEPNKDTCIYGDTDSLKLTAPIKGVSVGSELGEWDLEIDGEYYEYYRPKMYGQKIKIGEKIGSKAHRKGVPKRAVLLLKNASIEEYGFDKPYREKEAVKKNVPISSWGKFRKQLILQDDKRNWLGNESTPLGQPESVIKIKKLHYPFFPKDAPQIWYDIMEVTGGKGIRPFKDGVEYEEYQSGVPKPLRRKAGFAPDIIATMLHDELNYQFEDSEGLYQAIYLEGIRKTHISAIEDSE